MKLAAVTDVSDAARLALHVAVGTWLPWRAERRLARTIAVRLARFGGLRTPVTDHLRAAFGATLAPADLARLADANIQHRWTERELVWLWRMAWSAARRRALTRGVAAAGLEHLRASHARGHGAILLEAHIGRRVLAREALRQAGFPVEQVHARDHGGQDSRLGVGLRRLHRFLTRRAGVPVVELAPGSLADLRAFESRLRANAIVAIPGLGVAGDKLVAVDALGATLAVPTGTLSLARATGAALVPLFAFEDDTGRDHVVVEAPLPPPTAGDAGLIACAWAYVATVERHVRRHPEQWFWWFAPPDASARAPTTRRLAADQEPR